MRLTKAQRLGLRAISRTRLWGTSARQSDTNLNARTAFSLARDGLIERDSPDLQVRSHGGVLWQITAAGREALK